VDDSTKTLLKWSAIAAGAYIAYQYLQSSGLWAKWFGSGVSGIGQAPNVPTFNTQAMLLAHCAMNVTGQAGFIDGQGGLHVHPCVAWLMNDGRVPNAAAKQAAPTSPTAILSTAPDPRVATLQGILGDSASVEQWNQAYQRIQPGAPNVPPASSGAIDAATYISLRNASGLSGLSAAIPPLQPETGMEMPVYDVAYSWVN
jgi:hypothetical protein